MFKRILIPLDGSSLAECVLPHALALANHPEIYLLRVIDPAAEETRLSPGDPFEWNFRKVEAETYLKNIAARFMDLGLETHIFVGEGKTADTIIEYAQSHSVDLMIMSSHGKGGLTGWNVSSVVQKVVSRVHTSMMLIRAYQPVPSDGALTYQRILLPLDGSQRAEGVLQIAIEMARARGSELLAAHIVHQPEMPRRKPLSLEELQLAEKLIECNRAEAEQYLAELKHRFDIPVETHLLVSNRVASSLHQFVEKENVDLVMLNAHGFSGETTRPHGSVVATFIAYGSTPLLVYQDLTPENIQLILAEATAKERGNW